MTDALHLPGSPPAHPRPRRRGRTLRLAFTFWVLWIPLLPGTLSGEPPGASLGDGEISTARGESFTTGRVPPGPGSRGPGGSTPPEEPTTPGASEPRAVTLPQARGPAVARDHVVVRFRARVAPLDREAVAVGAGGRAYRPATYGDFGRVEVPPETSIPEVLARLRANPEVLWAAPDPIWSARLQAQPAPQLVDDPLFPLQWNLERIDWEEGFARNPTGGEGVVVAVIDSGVALGLGGPRAPDLEGVEVLPGIDLVDGGPAFDEGFALDPDAPATSMRFGHGTFVTSQIAAQVDNGLLIAGIAPEVTILPIRALDVLGEGPVSRIVEAINFAVDAGADVINLSLGGAGTIPALREAVNRAEQAGVLLVAAAGNEAADPEPPADVAFPGRIPKVFAVGATNFAGVTATYSNTGPGLDLVAPAGENPSIVRGETRDAVLSVSFLRDPVTGAIEFGAFFATGTSFAAPQVTAAAALLIALGVEDPDAVRFMLQETAVDLGPPGFDEQTGAGLLNVLRLHLGIGFDS
ncbi:MAG: S8 family serine peptidase [Thermoanaerobaculia bacterium]